MSKVIGYPDGATWKSSMRDARGAGRNGHALNALSSGVVGRSGAGRAGCGKEDPAIVWVGAPTTLPEAGNSAASSDSFKPIGNDSASKMLPLKLVPVSP